MKLQQKISRRLFGCSFTVALLAGVSTLAQAQTPLPPGELDRLVQRVALYPDPLLVQVLTASSYSDQIPEASRWADQHHYLSGDGLAAAISGDHLPWDPSVQALLPFPSVLEMMAADPGWTMQLGNAVLIQRDGVMDAVQRMRHKAYDYGYLRSGPAVVVAPGPYITILPARVGFYTVPVYDPAVVYFAPRAGFFVGGAVNFGFGVSIGAAFAPWGWGGVSFGWAAHSWVIGGRPWVRTWATRTTYVHPGYALPHYEAARRVETHELVERSAGERQAARTGHAPPVEEHHKK